MSVFVIVGTNRYVRGIAPEVTNVAELLSSMSLQLQELHTGIRENEPLGIRRPPFYILCNGQKQEGDNLLEKGKSYHIIPRLLGGKGGFGSMLRAIGAQIEKTTSREACRDLSGRRMRDINNEKKLKEWLAKEADREREREDRKQERLERRLRPSQHKFDDSQYHEQRSKVQEDLEDALQKGLKRTKKNDNSDLGAGPSKKSKAALSKDILGIDIDSDDLQSDSDNEADPGCSEEHCNSNPTSSSSGSTNTDGLTALRDHDPDFIKEEPNGHLSQSGGTQHEDILVNSNEVKTEEPVVKEEVVDPNEPVDLQDYNSSSELAVLGMERLKNALIERGLKCGGTLEERAGRLFSVKGLTQDQIDPSLFAKSKGKGKKSK